MDDNQHDRKLYWRKQRGTKVWKAVRDGQLKYVSEQSPQRTREYLFDLTADVGEQNDLKETHRVDFNRLRESYHHWEKRVRQNRRGKPNTASEQ
ncbi:hypothetical protein [Roseiconus lacunae]|uniref:hypothetical protein n=1 Tax=Roseiconus lacunae TaxID=2605694 RepID=UPI001F189F82|nr:hypothetical protein [Roseiconus lacunae]